ncbi:MAG TPA: gamma-glutamyl-gamma-aminobutyrate hydrolase family protein [Candidatus Dormibacteraeota bacterium]|nr:gamma-glutamyl-gamma-aminobutyrate hydrolase family protein [Candidatus Dormibacteraeota bacterium]
MTKRPIVLVTTRQTPRGIRNIDYVGELHLQLLFRLKIMPLIVPIIEGVRACLPEYMRQMDGLLLVEGEDIEPKRYAAQKENFRYLEKTHPLKDEVELRLLRHALRNKIPVLGICRGSQLINVACGGVLYGDVKKEKRSRLRHIHPDRYDVYRHPVEVVPGTPLARWYGRKMLRVNSYHHQGIRRLAHRLRPMAHAPDGLVEAYFDPRAEFLVGLQFHPERMLPEYRGNFRVWEAFAAAVHRRAGK